MLLQRTQKSRFTQLMLLIGSSLICSTVSHAATIVVGGYTFDENALANSLISSNGDFVTVGGDLASVLTDTDPSTYAFSRSAGASVTLGFPQNVANGPGTDLVLFELGVPDTFQVTIDGMTRSYASFDTGSSAGGFPLNAAEVNLDDFGFSAGATLNSITIGLDTVSATGTVPSLSLVGALNTEDLSQVPEPSFAPVFGLFGLAGCFPAVRRRLIRRSNS